MDFDTKLGYAARLQMFLATSLLIFSLILTDDLVSTYRLWEIFPAILASAITTFGLKEMKERT